MDIAEFEKDFNCAVKIDKKQITIYRSKCAGQTYIYERKGVSVVDCFDTIKNHFRVFIDLENKSEEFLFKRYCIRSNIIYNYTSFHMEYANCYWTEKVEDILDYKKNMIILIQKIISMNFDYCLFPMETYLTNLHLYKTELIESEIK